MSHRIAVLTFGILRAPEGDPLVQGFFDRDPPVLAAAERAHGFIARSGYDDDDLPPWGEHVYPRFFVPKANKWTPATLSLWVSLEALSAFTYSGRHGEAFAKGREWFVEPRWPTHAIWWVEEGQRPTWAEAAGRHEHLHDHGPSPTAFTLKHAFDACGAATDVDHRLVRQALERNRATSS